MLGGCASAPGASVLDKPLEWMGLKKPDLPAVELPPSDRKLTLRIHAGERLNTDPNSRSLSIVLRIYRLKDTPAFLAAPLEAFKDPASEKQAFGSDLVEVREVVLTPGQKYEVQETLPVAVTHLAVVAQFRAPAEGRWRFAFATKGADKTGITLGVHGCAMSVAEGVPVDTAPELLRLAGVQCR
jgi:type VI secretion system protein VasD